jgi:hypothetical protein
MYEKLLLTVTVALVPTQSATIVPGVTPTTLRADQYTSGDAAGIVEAKASGTTAQRTDLSDMTER